MASSSFVTSVSLTRAGYLARASPPASETRRHFLPCRLSRVLCSRDGVFSCFVFALSHGQSSPRLDWTATRAACWVEWRSLFFVELCACVCTSALGCRYSAVVAARPHAWEVAGSRGGQSRRIPGYLAICLVYVYLDAWLTRVVAQQSFSLYVGLTLGSFTPH